MHAPVDGRDDFLYPITVEVDHFEGQAIQIITGLLALLNNPICHLLFCNPRCCCFSLYEASSTVYDLYRIALPVPIHFIAEFCG
ncbi:hypothetical protein D3C77_696830 [compost metagenome]